MHNYTQRCSLSLCISSGSAFILAAPFTPLGLDLQFWDVFFPSVGDYKSNQALTLPFLGQFLLWVKGLQLAKSFTRGGRVYIDLKLVQSVIPAAPPPLKEGLDYKIQGFGQEYKI